MASFKGVTNKGLDMLRNLPRVSLGNIKSENRKNPKRGRGQHGGDKHGCGNKGSGQRMNWMRIGYETGNWPFYLRFPKEPYYNQEYQRRQYPPISFKTLQMLIDTDRLDPKKPIDLAAICNVGLFKFDLSDNVYGFQISDEGADLFKTKVNIETQHASELGIATIERLGGIITTSFYDMHSLKALINPKKFFLEGHPIPKRMLPPQDAAEYYTSATRRGYLANPKDISWERLVLSQKYGYKLPEIEKDPDYEMLMERKGPRQVFYGLQPGWVINLKEKIYPQTDRP